ncbi:leucyl aminopeptidase family protein [Nocardioides zeae]|uniref:Probable cytosol aminopeptidase n=1 Tax=Nocardioides imazamoxiresistens TaxID=3231893 RepID=A0ABU3PXS4_9ACTN|nr:leucyl aminopeptidase family protein [Nocardioides zeae]MDT9594039.1 leucyl aminopeptidase family protein [Nocardioides zeae]
MTSQIPLPLTGLPEQPAPPTFELVTHLGDELERVGPVVAVAVLRDSSEPDTADPSDTADAADTTDPAEGPALLLGPGAADVADRWRLDLLALLAAHRATGAAGEVVRVPLVGPEGSDASAPSDEPAVGLLLLVGVGDASVAELRRAGAATARATRGRERVVSTVPAAAADDAAVTAYVVGATLGSFAFSWTREPSEQGPVGAVALGLLGDGVDGPAADAVHRGVVLGRAGWTSRLLATVPSNVKSPAWLAEQAVALGAERGLETEVWEVDELERRGFGGIVGVGRASATPPVLIRLDYTPPGLSRAAARRTPRIVLVGKGITFDTGGLSIKPADGMRTMKRDMTGGAVVIATLAALAELEVPVRVTGLVATAENAIGGAALRPGDVLRHYGGRTSEVTNTDAEGRLVLADALAYAVDRLDPAVLVDVATLTGAGKVALGLRTGGLFATTDALADAFLAAGRSSGEPLWRLPLADVYEEKLASSIADADNAPGGPGAITAALFLRHFVGATPWVHLDIASVGDAAKDADEWTSGPTGFGPRLLLDWLTGLDPREL